MGMFLTHFLVLMGQEVDNNHNSAAVQYSRRLPDRRQRVICKMKHLVKKHQIHTTILQSQIIHIALTHLHIIYGVILEMRPCNT